MRDVPIYRHAWPVTVTPDRLAAGLRIRDVINDAMLLKSDPLSVLQKLTQRGFALVNLIAALRASSQPLSVFGDDFLILPSPMPRARGRSEVGYADALLIPKVLFLGITSGAFAEFRAASDSTLLELLRKIPGMPMLHSFSSVMELLESTMVLADTPPVLLAISNFVIDIGQPMGVCDSDRMPIKRVNSRSTHPVFSELLSRLGGIRSGKVEAYTLKAHIESLDVELTNNDDRLLCHIAKFFALDYLADRAVYRKRFAEDMGLEVQGLLSGRNTVVSTDLRYLSAMPHAVALVRDGILNGPMTPVLREVSKIVWSSGVVVPHPEFRRLFKSPIRDVPASRELVDPFDLYDMYLLTDDPPDEEDLYAGRISIEQAAIWLMCMLLADCWQRHCGLVSIELRHFSCGTHFQDLRITHSKTGPVNQSIPLWALLSAKSGAFVAAFIRYCLNHLKLPPTMRLTEIAGVGRFERGSWHEAQKRFVSKMHLLAPEFNDSTHLPRATGLSWAPIRALVAFNEELIRHPKIERMREHAWFSDDGLARFRQLLLSEETDSLEVYRRIACWSTGEQFIKTYCRSSHLLFELHLFLNE